METWIVVDEEYLSYLREYDPRVPFSNYGADKMKPFFGELFSIGDLVYITPISHPQARHNKMKNAPDFQKVYAPDKNSAVGDRLIAVVNLKYMIPIPKDMITPLVYADIEQHRTFKTEQDKSKYIDLLKTELEIIKKSNIVNKASRLYNLKINYPDNVIAQRCIDFKLLETKAMLYSDSKFQKLQDDE